MEEALIAHFQSQFGADPQYLFSAPGRTEICGNHTDHQGGMVLAAAVDLETTAAVRVRKDAVIRLVSEGYPACEIALNDLSVHEDELGTTSSLIRGVAAGFFDRGCMFPGFDAFVTSTVLSGSGLSSSAAFEILIASIFNYLCKSAFSPLELAKIGQSAENRYFGKPCGLMDQAASAAGGIVFIDFAGGRETKLERLQFDFSAYGYTLCVVDCGADHADLTPDYAAIPTELKAVSAVFGKSILRDVDENEFYMRLPEVRAAAGDRAVLRAIHIFDENRRVLAARDALKNGDLDVFFTMEKSSGRSSQLYLQNILPHSATVHQDLALALALAEKLLDGEGACRVHGGGFAGTLLAFVPEDLLPRFRREMEAVFGEGSCHMLSVNPNGGRLKAVL